MPIVKKIDGMFVESYEINAFTVSIDQKNVTVTFSKYTLSSSGVPTAEDFSYSIYDRDDVISKKKNISIPSVKRSESGAVVLDDSGNPVVEYLTQEVDGSEKVTINALSEMISGLTTGKNLYAEIKLALYKSFIKYYLKDDTSYTIE